MQASVSSVFLCNRQHQLVSGKMCSLADRCLVEPISSIAFYFFLCFPFLFPQSDTWPVQHMVTRWLIQSSLYGFETLPSIALICTQSFTISFAWNNTAVCTDSVVALHQLTCHDNGKFSGVQMPFDQQSEGQSSLNYESINNHEQILIAEDELIDFNFAWCANYLAKQKKSN